MRFAAVMEMTTIQIWWLYETAHEQDADDRRRFVSDVAAAAGSLVSESGFKNFKEHMERLSAASPA